MWTFGPHNNRRNRHRYDETVQHPVRDPDADKAIGADYEKVGVCAIGCGNIGQICLPTVAEQRRRKKEEIRSRHGDVTRFIDGPQEVRSARETASRFARAPRARTMRMRACERARRVLCAHSAKSTFLFE